MKRFHVHLSVPDLAASIRFYSALFGEEPTVRKVDYAKWMIDDPRVNFAISASREHAGLHHLGLQVDSPGELAGVRARYHVADSATLVDEAQAHCCYALSDKHWVTDPQGIAWEGFRTIDSRAERDGESACCADAKSGGGAAAVSACCTPAAGVKEDAATRTCCG